MAKNRNRDRRDRSPKFSPFSHRLRDDFSIASDPDRTFEPVSRSLHVPDQLDRVLEYLDNPVVRSKLREFEDHRTYRPIDEVDQPRSSRSVAKVKMVDGRFGLQQVFTSPRAVLVCVRRKIRKEIMHALGRTGRGGVGNRTPRFNARSKVRC